MEKVCLELPYVREASIMGIEDEEFGERVAAVITMVSSSKDWTLGIDQLRDDLRKSLPAYKLPTLLRVLDHELPKGPTGKVQKKSLGSQLFGPSWPRDDSVQVWRTAKARL